MKQKLFSLLFAIAASIGTMFAWDYEHVQIGDLYYNLNATDQTAEVTSQNSSYPYWSKTITTANIPASVTYSGTKYSVTSIGNLAFWSCSGLTSVTIGNGVISIGNDAFSGCSSLTSVTIPNSVTSIGDYAFYNCSSLTSVTIGNSVTKIGKYAFDGCRSLTSVSIGNSVTSIGNYAFNNCSSLTSVTLNSNAITSRNYSRPSSLKDIFGLKVKEYILGEGVTSIGENAFYNCSSLTSVTIPNSVTSIGGVAFGGCNSLTSITIPNSVTSIGGYAFYGCSSLTSPVYNAHVFAFMPTSYSGAYTIPNEIESIAGYAFYGCNSLTSITIPNSVTSVGYSAFSGCNSLTSITIGNSVTSIGYEAFAYCTSLTSIDIPNSVTSIGENAFYDCSKVTSVTIPNGVTGIGENAFKDVFNVVYSGTATGAPWGAKNMNKYPDGWLVYEDDTQQNLLICNTAATEISLPNSLTTIQPDAFSGCNKINKVTLCSNTLSSKTYSSSSNITSIFGDQVTEYILGEGVISIGDYAFYNAANLQSLTIESSIVTSIGNNAFGNCPQLSQVTVNSNAVVSKAYSPTNNFANIFGTQVQKYTLGDAITSIGDYAFSGCSNVTALNTPTNVTKIGNGAFQNCSGVESFNIPESVISIGDHAFNGCSGISSVAVPNISSIGTNAFGDCSNITSVQFGNSLVSIGDSAFSSCYNLAAVQFPSSLQSIGNYAFYQCNRIPSVDIVSNITSLGEGVFKGCSKLTQVSVNSNAVMSKAYSATNNFATIFGKQVSAYSLGDAITAIGDYAFYGNNISSLTIPSSVASIGKSAFQGCSAITTMAIPDAVTIIENKTFQGCTSLASITMPDAITAIKDSAFLNCSSLVINSFPAKLTSLGSSAFSGCSSITDIAFPAGLKTIGENAFANCIGVARIEISDLAAWCAIEFGNSQSNPLFYARNLYVNNELVSELVIPNKITELKNWVFNNCSSITSVVIPNTVKAVLPTAFSGCENIASVEWHSKNVTDYASSDNAPFYASRKKVKEFIIGEEVEHIPAYLCDGMSGIGSLAFPSYLKSIGDCAFKGLTKIKLINVPNEVTAIGAHAFDSCILVTSIYLGYQVEEIGDYAFKGCIRVNDITSMNTTTPVVYDNTLSSISQYAYLYVQAGSKRTYQLDPYWSRFDIQELASEEASLTSDAVIVEANSDNAIFTWPVCDTAAYYSLQITKDEEVFCTLVFNSNGQLTSIAFAPGRNGNAHAPAATMSIAGMSFTVTGLNTASKYAYRLAVLDEDNAELVAYGGEFATTGYTGDINPGGEPIATAIDGLTIDVQKTTKVIRDGQLFILRDGNTYTIQGQEVR